MAAVRVLITGAAGQIGYSLIFMIAKGDMFGPNQPVILHLLDIPQMDTVLSGVVIEIEDCALPLVHGVLATSDAEKAFAGVDYALLVGSMPRREGMLRSDLLKANVGIFKTQGEILNRVASKNIKVLVVGNPANTNASVCATCAPDIPRENFSALTRLDHNRARAQIAKRLGESIDHIHNVVIWGNHSNTQYADVSNGFVNSKEGKKTVVEAIKNDEWIRNEFLRTVQTRGAAVIAARKLSSAASAATAICDHMRDWVMGTHGEIVSMAVVSNGEYGIHKGLMFSFPVVCADGKYKIIDNFHVDDYSRVKLLETEKELIEEQETAFNFLK